MKHIGNERNLAAILLDRITSTDKCNLEKHEPLRIELVERVWQVLPGSVLRSVVSHIPKQIIADAIGTSTSNLNRLFKKNLAKNKVDILDDVTLLWHELRLFFNFDDVMLKEWVDNPLPALNGKTPAFFMSTVSGRNAIRILIDKMHYGDL